MLLTMARTDEKVMEDKAAMDDGMMKDDMMEMNGIFLEIGGKMLMEPSL